MRRLLPGLIAMSLWAASSPVRAQESVPPPRPDFVRPLPPATPVYDPTLTPYAPPFSRDPNLRAQQTVARQLAVNNWTRGFNNAWALYVPDDYWLLGPPPLTWAWDFPPVEQPIGQQRIYDGRGGYSSFPVYANQLVPAPARLAPPPADVGAPAVEVARRTRETRHPPAGAPAARTAEAPRRLFSW